MGTGNHGIPSGTMRDVPSLVEFWRDRYNCQNEHRAETEGTVHFVYDS